MVENNNGDFITINTKDGLKKSAELVSKFNIQGLGEYVIYKLDNKYYGAKYLFDGEKTTLITDLSDNEKEALNAVFAQLEVE